MSQYITSEQVTARYSISQMTLWRWENTSPELAFPKQLRINRRKLWSLSDLDAWDAFQRIPIRLPATA